MRASVAMALVVALAAPARALITFETTVGRNFSGGGGSSFTTDGGEPPVMAGGDYTFSRGGAYCPDPSSADYVCASYFGFAGLVGNRIVMKSSATLTRKQAVGLGYNNSDYLVYADTTVEIYNLANSVSLGTGIVYFVFGLHGVASTTKTSDQVLTQATGVAMLSGSANQGLQCTGDPCPPIRVRAENFNFAPDNASAYNVTRVNLRADARAGAPVGFPYDAEMIADFGDTLELMAIEIHDADDNPRPDAHAILLDAQGQPILTFDNSVATTTTTTLPGGTTTTSTTLPGGGCEPGPSYTALTCRVDGLRALVGQQNLGKIGKALDKALGKASSAITQASASTDKKRARALRKATKAVTAYGRKLDAKGAVKKIDGTLRDTLKAPVPGILTDLAAL